MAQEPSLPTVAICLSPFFHTTVATRDAARNEYLFSQLKVSYTVTTELFTKQGRSGPPSEGHVACTQCFDLGDVRSFIFK